MNFVPAVIVFAALLSARPGHAATPGWEAPGAAPARIFAGEARGNAGKSFRDHLATIHAEEPSYSLPATFQAGALREAAFAGPLAAPPREPETYAMLLASLGLMVYLGRRRRKALAALP